MFKITQPTLDILNLRRMISHYNIEFLSFSNEEDESIFNDSYNNKNGLMIKTYSNEENNELKSLYLHSNNHLAGIINYYYIDCNFNEFEVKDAKEINDYIRVNEAKRDRYKWLLEEYKKRIYFDDFITEIQDDLYKVNYISSWSERCNLSFKYNKNKTKYKVETYINRFIKGKYILHCDMINDIVKNSKNLIESF